MDLLGGYNAVLTELDVVCDAIGESLNVLHMVLQEQIPVWPLADYRVVHRYKMSQVVIRPTEGWEGRGTVCLPHTGLQKVRDFISSGFALVMVPV